MTITNLLSKTGTTALATACLFVSVSTTMAAPPVPVAGTYGTVVIGDLPGMVDRGAELAKKVSPGISGDVIRGQLGMMLGDEGLKSVPAGSGLVVVMPESGSSFLLLETAEGKAETVGNLLKQRLGASTKAVNSKLVAVAMGEPALAKATGAMGTSAAALLNDNDDKFIVATVDADQLIKDKGAQIDSALANLSSMAAKGDAGSSSSAKMLDVVAQMVKSIAKRTDVATIKIDVSGDGILFDKTLYPVGGVTLAKPEGPSGQELLKSVDPSADALTRFESYTDTQSAISTMNAILAEVLQVTDLSQQDKDSITNLIKTAAEGFGDGTAASIAMDKDGTNGTYLVSVINQEKALQYIDDASKLFSQNGVLGKMYTAMGWETSMTLTRNVGTIEGQPVHQFSFSMKPPSGAGFQMASMSKPKTGKFTFIDNKLVIALGKTSLDEVVAAVQAGTAAGSTELDSRAKLPAGGAFYMDYNIGALASVLRGENADAADALEGVKGTSILEAIYTDAESIKLVVKIPGEMITQGIDAAKNMAQKRAAETQDADAADDADTADDAKVTTAPAQM